MSGSSVSFPSNGKPAGGYLAGGGGPGVIVIQEYWGLNDQIKGVAIRGRAEFLDDSPARRQLVERFLTKYHPQLEKYWNGRVMPPNSAMFRIVPVCAST